MAFDIAIESGYFVVTDTSAVDYINHPRASTRFTVSGSTYRFYQTTPTVDGSVQSGILGGENNSFAYADLGAVTEDSVEIVIASQAALSTYLRSKISFFFNDDPLNTGELIAANEVNNNRLTTAIQTLIDEQRLTNKLLQKIYNPI